jgi:hypothetical protein
MRSPREAEQPRDLRYMQLAVVEVTDCKIATVLKYFSEVQTLRPKPSRKRFLAHSPACEQHLPRTELMRQRDRREVERDPGQTDAAFPACRVPNAPLV